ncbi:MAG TPA: LacI family DNA-binding transcriptional regulator [Mesorhizobium sp.]|nr:LacI family DNA-binding transcriptional regulator [Mesorhizobium sp.]
MGRKVTARDVAKAAGVSPATVDRVLNTRGGVRPDKEAAVIEAARRLGLDRALQFKAARTLKIAVLLQAPQNPFHAAVQAAFSAAGRTHADLNMQFRIFHAAPTDVVGMAARIAALARSHDGLILTCPDAGPIVDAVNAAAGRVPVITFATDLPESARHVYVGPDDVMAGRLAGDLMGRFLPESGGEVVLIAGVRSMTGQRRREAGFGAVLAERYPRLTLGAVLECEEDAAKVAWLVRRALAEMPGLRGIYNASVGSREVVAALKAAGSARKVVFITHELTQDRQRLLREGAIDAIIDQNPAFAVHTAVLTMARLLGRGTAEPLAPITPVNIHMIENAG